MRERAGCEITQFVVPKILQEDKLRKALQCSSGENGRTLYVSRWAKKGNRRSGINLLKKDANRHFENRSQTPTLSFINVRITNTMNDSCSRRTDNGCPQHITPAPSSI
ncbi:hypothetical protein TNCV_3739911 [Trichonephila clavipes]|nr:hypothetical protein TNCV_3739911 [Trichonephila clavipes]